MPFVSSVGVQGVQEVTGDQNRYARAASVLETLAQCRAAAVGIATASRSPYAIHETIVTTDVYRATSPNGHRDPASGGRHAQNCLPGNCTDRKKYREMSERAQTPP